jgi:hypothetical protein
MHRDGFAFELTRALNALVFVADQLHQGARTQHRHGLDRNALRAGDDGRVANGAANDGIACAHLFGHIDTAAGCDEFHIQAFGLVVALGLRQHPGPKGGQCARCGQQVSHFLQSACAWARQGGSTGSRAEGQQAHTGHAFDHQGRGFFHMASPVF